MNNPFRRFFRSEEEESEGMTLAHAHKIISFGREGYFDDFMDWLEQQADKPLETTDNISMLKSATRINTFKEIRLHLKKEIRWASDVIAREADNG